MTMEFTVNRDALLKPLQVISGVVERQQTLPILSHTLLRIDGNNLSLYATDLEVELIGRVNLNSSTTSGDITVPALTLLQICRSLSEDAVLHFSMNKESVIIKSGRSRFTLSTLPAKDFPTVDNDAKLLEFSLLQKELRYLIERTSFAMAVQDVRYYLNGLLFEINKESVRCVATDGHRLAVCSLPLALGIEPQKIIVPRKACVELLRLLSERDETVTLHTGANHIRFITAEFTFTSKLVEGKFPDVDRVIPKTGNKSVVLNKDSFKQSLSRVSILANDKLRGVHVRLNSQKMYLSSNNLDKNEAQEELEINYPHEDSFDIGFNINYLMDFLGVASSQEVKLIFSDAQAGTVIQEVSEAQFTYVVMPMRL